GEVLREDEHLASQDRLVTGHDGIPPGAPLAHVELDLTVSDEAVELDEAARVEQLLDTLVRKQLAALALPSDGRFVAGVSGFLAELTEPCELRLGRVVHAHEAGA